MKPITLFTALISTQSLVYAGLPSATPVAVQQPPYTTLASPPIIKDPPDINIATNGKITFTEGTTDKVTGGADDTRFKFPGIKVYGTSKLKIYSDGTYDHHGLIRHDDPSNKPYTVAFWWKIIDKAGRKYYFGSQKCTLKHKGDVCDWSQDNKYYENGKIKSHWKDLEMKAQPTAFPVRFP